MIEIPWSRVIERANLDGEFRIAARLWNGSLRLDFGDRSVRLEIADGGIRAAEPCAADAACDASIGAARAEWERLLELVPKPLEQDLFGLFFQGRFALDGDLEMLFAYYPAIRRLVDLIRAALAPSVAARAEVGGAAAKDKTSPITGHYVQLAIDGAEYRVYFEENGSGIPLLLQHTAGADGRQWRHLLEDRDLARHFRMIAYDLPYHGKSLPPEGVEWWREEYRLTTDFLMKVPVVLGRSLGLERPVYMGSSIGGHLAGDLALHYPDVFSAVIGLEAAAYTPGGYLDIWYHPRIGNEFKASVMFGLMSPTSPERFRRETAWVYSQGAPPVFKGDLHYFSVDHDLRETAAKIDTSKVAVYLLTGEYDWAATAEMSRELASRIPGAFYRTMDGLGHFPMSEDPERFLGFIRPVLEEIRARSRGT